jgi:hypothetical protein
VFTLFACSRREFENGASVIGRVGRGLCLPRRSHPWAVRLTQNMNPIPSHEPENLNPIRYDMIYRFVLVNPRPGSQTGRSRASPVESARPPARNSLSVPPFRSRSRSRVISLSIARLSFSLSPPFHSPSLPPSLPPSLSPRARALSPRSAARLGSRHEKIRIQKWLAALSEPVKQMVQP